MVAESDTYGRGAEEKEEQEDLEKIEPMMPDEKRNPDHRGDEGSNEKNAIDPADLIEKFVHKLTTDVVNLCGAEIGVIHPSAVRRSDFVVFPPEDSSQILQFASVRFSDR